MNSTNILVVMVVFVVVAVLVLVGRRRGQPAPEVRGRADDDTLRRYHDEGCGYRFWIAESARRPRWREAAELRGDRFIFASGPDLALSEARIVLVTYPSGEVLDSRGPIRTLPDAAYFPGPAEIPVAGELDPSRFEAGAAWVEVTHSKGKVTADGRLDHATTLRNVTSEPVRVLAFGAYRRVGGRWELSTITRSLFSEEQFGSWYGLPGGWLAPGASATDPHNYGGRGSLWAYLCETESGRRFVTGATVT